MLNLEKLIASAKECLGWPYVSPGSNDSRGIDCSGLFVKCFRDQGASIYHGSNTIYRKYCSDKGKLTSVSQLKPGMAVFKWNSNTPAKFNDDLGDFQHIGMVTGVSPLQIVHASSAAGCVTTDTKLGKWAYWGWLKDVDDEGEEETMSTETKRATVTAPSGSTVNLRVKPSTGSALVERISIGTAVDVLSESGEWTQVKAGNKTGYMMTVFLAPIAGETGTPESGGTIEERLARLEERVSYLENVVDAG